MKAPGGRTLGVSGSAFFWNALLFTRALRAEGLTTDLGAAIDYLRSIGMRTIARYEQELHDRLLSEVLTESAEEDGYTLFNVLAKRDAEALLASSEEYF